MPSRLIKFSLLFAVLITFLAAYVFAQSPTSAVSATAVASRVEGSNTLYYSTLHEAVKAASGLSPETPNEITLLADISVYAPIEIEEGQHIRLVPGGGSWTVLRGRDFIDFPVFWVRGDDSSLSLGKPDMENELIIDGGYLNSTSIQAYAPLVAVNGRNSRLMMYDGVSIQNNYNIGVGEGTGLYQNGSGVFIRTVDNDMDNMTEFIMKGGIIQGNTNNAQNPIACGGGVYIAGFGLFTMEGGVIMNNTAYVAGGGFHTGSRGSFKKKGGIIYGSNAPDGYRNTVIDGVGTPVVFGHAICVANFDGSFNYWDGTVEEIDRLSYIGSPRENGVFGTGERWYTSAATKNNRINPIIIIILSVAVPGFLIMTLLKRARQKLPETVSVLESIDELNIEFTPKEQKVLDLLFTDLSFKVIADTLQLTHDGVTYHSKKIYSKVGVKNRNELLAKHRRKETVIADP